MSIPKSRDLVVIDNNTVEFNKFSSYYTNGYQRVKKIVTQKEMVCIQNAILSNDEFEIDSICYSIA